MTIDVASSDSPRPLAWLFAMPPHSERTMRMEALIARIRLFVLVVNTLALALLLDTSGMDVDSAWLVLAFAYLYAIPTALLEPYRRWRVFQTSIVTVALDSIVTAVFMAVTGGADSPYYMLYYLLVASVAMRFELAQALVMCFWYALLYAVVFLWSWEASTHEGGLLFLRLSYMFFISLGVGHLAREEIARSRQIDEIERLNAQNQRLQTRNDRAARFDRLTGVLNRGFFEKDAQRELRKARAGGSYLSVLFCDMDKLKRINDELGHDAGDRVLHQAGAVLKRSLRANDIIGRYGGDEFVAVLPNLTRESAWERAEQLIEGVQACNDLLPEDLHVGLSVGIATFPFDAQDYPTLVRVADQAMYLAKRDGGNKVRSANDLRVFWEDMPQSQSHSQSA